MSIYDRTVNQISNEITQPEPETMVLPENVASLTNLDNLASHVFRN